MLRLVSVYIIMVVIIIIIILLLLFNKSIMWYQYITYVYNITYFNYSFLIGIDILSIVLLILSSFLLMNCLLISRNIKYKINIYIYLLLYLYFLLLNLFIVLDIYIFFILFESLILPVFLLIGVWGSRSRKVYAAYQFFLYTILGSLFILICILDIYMSKGSMSFEMMYFYNFFDNRNLIFWICLFLGFSVKIPIFPFHVWLPEAHVEASSTGSVVLAGILLKLGVYGIYRIILGTFSNIYVDILFLILVLSFLGLTYSALVALNQIDIKKMVAYSSISHMNFSLLGVFSCTMEGLLGCFVMMIGHALTSSGLFLSIGILYERYKTRIIFYYGGLANLMPVFSIIMFIFVISNFSFPGTLNFVGEFFILGGGLISYKLVMILSSLSLLLSLIYSLFLYNRIFYGIIPNYFRYYSDCTRLEYKVLMLFVFFVVLLGLYPCYILDFGVMFFNKIYFFII